MKNNNYKRKNSSNKSNNKSNNKPINSNRNNNKVTLLVLTAMMTAMTLIATMFLKIPIAVGYIHLGDAMVVLAAIILPKRYACFSAAVGTALADILGGFAVWAPWTFAIKLFMVLIISAAYKAGAKENLAGERFAKHFGYFLSGVVTIGGYYVAEGFLFGNWMAPLAGVPFNFFQITIGVVIALSLSEVLKKTPLYDYLNY